MTQYSRKIIQNLKPEWYLALNQHEKLKEQNDLQQRHKEAWDNKPKSIPRGLAVVAKESVRSVTKNRKYYIQGHFCYLVTTIYMSEWNQFITLKNDDGWTVKMNLDKFEIYNANSHDPLTKRINELEKEVALLKSK